MKKADVLIFGIVLALVAIAGLGVFLMQQAGGRLFVVMQKDGEELLRTPLEGSNTHEWVKDSLGYNDVVIEDGHVAVQHADCPDKLCVERGSIDKAGQSIVCLPHKLVIRIEGQKADIDSVAE